MARFLLALFAALWLAGCGGADPTAPRDWPEPSPALWEVTAPGGQKGWLFGVVHALPDGAEWRTETVENAFAEAGLLVVEIAELGDTQASFDAFRARAYSDGLPPLSERVDPDRQPVLDDLLERAGAKAEDFAGMESWAAAMVLASAIRTGDPENGVDRALIESGKPVVGLESFDTQYAMFDTLPEASQADMLAGLALEAGENTSQDLLDAWLAGDDRFIEEQTKRGFLARPALRERLLVRRNEAWSGRVAQLVENGRQPFVAVGAAHVVGDSGLVAMLEERGFAVSRLQ